MVLMTIIQHWFILWFDIGTRHYANHYGEFTGDRSSLNKSICFFQIHVSEMSYAKCRPFCSDLIVSRGLFLQDRMLIVSCPMVQADCINLITGMSWLQFISISFHYQHAEAEKKLLSFWRRYFHNLFSCKTIVDLRFDNVPLQFVP